MEGRRVTVCLCRQRALVCRNFKNHTRTVNKLGKVTGCQTHVHTAVVILQTADSPESKLPVSCIVRLSSGLSIMPTGEHAVLPQTPHWLDYCHFAVRL